MHGSRRGLTLPYPPENFKLKSVIKMFAIKLLQIGFGTPPPPTLKRNRHLRISGVNINRVKPSMLYCYPST